MNTKEERLKSLSEIPLYTGIDHRLLKDKKGNLNFLSTLKKSEQRKLKKDSIILMKKYEDILNRVKNSGKGFIVDRFLRELVFEYNHRYASSGISTQPLNFNYFEAFCNIKLFSNSYAPYIIPALEINHLFNITDFFNYVTSEKGNDFNLSSLLDLIENKTLHFTVTGNVMDFSFLNSKGNEFVISGFSVIRRGSILHWYLVGGELFSDEEWSIVSSNLETDESNNISINPLKKAFIDDLIKIHSNFGHKPIPLEGTERTLKTILSGEIDLQSQKYLGCCVMFEKENSFEILCDDPTIFDNYKNDSSSMIEHINKRMESMSVLWDIVSSLFQLPTYFSFKLPLDKQIVDKAGDTVKRIRTFGGDGLNATYKTIPSLEINKENTPVIQKLIPQHYKIDNSGYWRKLSSPESKGKAPDGSEIKGKTWIKSENTWKIDINSDYVYIKSTIKSAEIKIDEYYNAVKSLDEKNDIEDEGVLYIMRCGVMKDEIYKVGWTSSTAENRAKELSSATGVHISFIVVKYWKHNRPKELEKTIHAILEPYRINEYREFFNIKYSILEKMIENEIKKFN